MGLEHFCPRQPDLVLSGINYGSNASINIVYSGTIGAVLEACLNGCQAIGFSLLNHNPAADFDACTPSIRHILDHVLANPLPDYTALNVNCGKGCNDESAYADRQGPRGKTGLRNVSTLLGDPIGG